MLFAVGIACQRPSDIPECTGSLFFTAALFILQLCIRCCIGQGSPEKQNQEEIRGGAGGNPLAVYGLGLGVTQPELWGWWWDWKGGGLGWTHAWMECTPLVTRGGARVTGGRGSGVWCQTEWWILGLVTDLHNGEEKYPVLRGTQSILNCVHLVCHTEPLSSPISSLPTITLRSSIIHHGQICANWSLYNLRGPFWEKEPVCSSLQESTLSRKPHSFLVTLAKLCCTLTFQPDLPTSTHLWPKHNLQIF